MAGVGDTGGGVSSVGGTGGCVASVGDTGGGVASVGDTGGGVATLELSLVEILKLSNELCLLSWSQSSPHGASLRSSQLLLCVCSLSSCSLSSPLSSDHALGLCAWVDGSSSEDKLSVLCPNIHSTCDVSSILAVSSGQGARLLGPVDKRLRNVSNLHV